MAKHDHIHTRFNAHSKGTLSPIHKGYMLSVSAHPHYVSGISVSSSSLRVWYQS